MNGTVFDTLSAAKALREAGFEDRQAEAVTGVVRRAVGADRDALATRADVDSRFAALRAAIDAIRADMDARFDAIDARFAASRVEARADLYRALWIQTGAIAGLIFTAAGFVVAAVKLL